MEKNQNNKLSMGYSVQKVCNNYQSEWTGFVAFETAFNDFESILNNIGKSLDKQGIHIKGVSEDKIAAKELLTDKALEIGGAVFAFATDNNNLALKARVHLSRTNLSNTRNALTVQRCQLIYDEASAIINQLGNYGLTSSSLADFQSKIDAFTAMIAAPRTAITERKGATDDIDKLMKKINAILTNKMDKLMEKYKTVNPEFYRQYFDARIIIDSGMRHKAAVNTTPAASK